MKKHIFLSILFILAVSLYAFDIPNRSIFIEGTAQNNQQRQFFMENFRMEASALGFSIADNKDSAGYVFRFEVHPYDDEYDPSIRSIILITLTHNELGVEMVSFGWPFGELEDMYEHNQFVFYRAAVLIPSVSDEELGNLVQAAGTGTTDNTWRNKWLYLRLSALAPIAFYELLPNAAEDVPDGLKYAIYQMTEGDITNFRPMDHLALLQPGASIGLEIQFLNFMSLGLSFQATFGDVQILNNDSHLNLTAAAQLMFPLKFSNSFVLAPYLTGTLPLTTADHPAIESFPEFFVGGGIQIAVRGGRSGALFFDIGFLTAFSDLQRVNPDVVLGKDEYGADRGFLLSPEYLFYRPYILTIGVGYKFGFFNR